MLFNSSAFLFFAIVFFSVYFFLRRDLQHIWLCVSSYFFYGWWDWRFLFLLWASTFANYVIATLMGRSDDDRGRHRLLVTGIVVNLSVLGIFKYFAFFMGNFVAAANSIGWHLTQLEIRVIFPIAISFYTFHSINYVVDVYRHKIPVERSLLRYAVYIALWPQLVAGPIVRASRLLPQLRHAKTFRWCNLQKGSEYIVIGFLLKVVVADNAAPIVDRIFGDPAAFSGINLAIGVILFAFQIYGDFAGYSLIAIGFARLMGFNLGRNFRRPYLAADFSDFWTRWHISLSSWLRDYLYIPLGGSRKGPMRERGNLMTTMLLGGLWHGASWMFLLWGGVHGAVLVVQRSLGGLIRRVRGRQRIRPSALPGRLARSAVVFLVACLAWVFFRADSLSQSWAVLNGIAAKSWQVSTIQNPLSIAPCVIYILVLMTIELLVEFTLLDRRLARYKRMRALLAALGIVVIPMFGNFSGASFIYFEF